MSLAPDVQTAITEAVAAEVRRYDQRQAQAALELASRINHRLASIEERLTELFREIRHDREAARADAMASGHLLQRFTSFIEAREAMLVNAAAPTPPSPPRHSDITTNEPLRAGDDPLPTVKK